MHLDPCCCYGNTVIAINWDITSKTVVKYTLIYRTQTWLGGKPSQPMICFDDFGSKTSISGDVPYVSHIFPYTLWLFNIAIENHHFIAR